MEQPVQRGGRGGLHVVEHDEVVGWGPGAGVTEIHGLADEAGQVGGIIGERGVPHDASIPGSGDEIGDDAAMVWVTAVAGDIHAPALALAVDDHRVMGLRQAAPDLVRVEQVDDQRPAMGVEHEAVGVVMAVVPLLLATLEREERGVGVLPTAAKEGPVDVGEERVEGEIGERLRLDRRVVPEEGEGVRMTPLGHLAPHELGRAVAELPGQAEQDSGGAASAPVAVGEGDEVRAVRLQQCDEPGRELAQAGAVE